MDALVGMWHRQGGRPWLPLLYPASLFYRLGVEARLLLYRKGILPSLGLPLKVVSVGNLTVGGSGKTPVTIYLARLMASWGYRVAVLSRGYKGKRRGRINVVSDGKDTFLTSLEAGDEPYLMASKLKGIPVLTGKDRYSLALYAKEVFGTEVVVLDDGFQHLRLKKDIDILILTRDVFERPYLLPMGRMREPFKGVERADLVLLKDGEPSKRVVGDKPFFTFSYIPIAFKDVRGGSILAPQDIRGKKIFAFSGIAFPSSFISTLKKAGAVVEGAIAYPDHHLYCEKDVERIKEKARGVDLIVTTEKDGVKLRDFKTLPPNLYILEVEVLFEEEEAFKKLLKKRLGIR